MRMEAGGEPERRDRDFPEPELGIIPTTPDVEKDPYKDIPPEIRQRIIDDITRQEEEERERIRRIDEGGPFPSEDKEEVPPTRH